MLQRSRCVIVLLALVAACGHGADPLLPDAAAPTPDAAEPTPDASVDAPPAPATFRVRVERPDGSGAPDPGVRVLFHDAAGAVAAEATTDADGRLEQAAAGVSSVTVIQRGLDGPIATTFAAVEAGAELVIVHPGGRLGTDLQPFDITVPPVENVTQYTAFTPCSAPVSGPGPTLQVRIDRACSGDRTDLVVVADRKTGDVGKYLRQSIALNAEPIEIEEPFKFLAITGVLMRYVTGTVTLSTANLIGRRTQGAAREVLRTGVSSPPAEIGYAFYRVPDIAGPMAFTIDLDGDFHRYLRSGPPPQSVYAHFGAVPSLKDPSLDGRTVRWTSTGGGDYDGSYAVSSWSRDGATHRWRFVMPPGTTSYVVPELPPDLESLSPVGQTVAIEVNAFAIAGTDRWAEFLARATTLGMAMRDPAQLAESNVEVEIWSTERFDGATTH